MKRMARWALALASVMLVPTSAMALVGAAPHKATILNGRQNVDVGVWRFTLDQLVIDPYSFEESCAFFVKWINYASLASSTNVFVQEVATVGIEDCEENSYIPQASVLKLSSVPEYFDKSLGFDKFQQKRKIFRLLLAEDPYNGVMNGVIQYHPTAVPYGFKLTPAVVPPPVYP
jgi:hypothetical protein